MLYDQVYEQDDDAGFYFLHSFFKVLKRTKNVFIDDPYLSQGL